MAPHSTTTGVATTFQNETRPSRKRGSISSMLILVNFAVAGTCVLRNGLPRVQQWIISSMGSLRRRAKLKEMALQGAAALPIAWSWTRPTTMKDPRQTQTGSCPRCPSSSSTSHLCCHHNPRKSKPKAKCWRPQQMALPCLPSVFDVEEETLGQPAREVSLRGRCQPSVSRQQRSTEIRLAILQRGRLEPQSGTRLKDSQD